MRNEDRKRECDGLWRNRADIKLVMLTKSTVAEDGTFWAKAELVRGEGKIWALHPEIFVSVMPRRGFNLEMKTSTQTGRRKWECARVITAKNLYRRYSGGLRLGKSGVNI